MEKIADWFISQGIFGIIIVVMGYVVIKLSTKYDEIQEKRIAESRESIKAIEQNTNTLETMTEVLRERSNR